MSHNNTRSNAAQVENTNAANQQVKTRCIETRDQWDVIFAHSVALVVAHIRGQHMDNPRSGYKFGKTDVQPHARGYAQSLLTGFTTSKAGKVLAEDENLADKANRVKIATAILVLVKLAKGNNKGETDEQAALRIMAKSEPKREKAFATAVLEALAKPIEEPKAEEPKTTPSKRGSKGGKKSKPAKK